MLQRKINARSNKRRRNNETANLNLKPSRIVRILMQQTSAYIAQPLSEGAETESEEIGPCFEADAEVDVGEAEEEEGGAEEGVHA